MEQRINTITALYPEYNVLFPLVNLGTYSNCECLLQLQANYWIKHDGKRNQTIRRSMHPK